MVRSSFKRWAVRILSHKNKLGITTATAQMRINQPFEILSLPLIAQRTNSGDRLLKTSNRRAAFRPSLCPMLGMGSRLRHDSKIAGYQLRKQRISGLD